MKKEFATYEIALKLKELGFNEDCFGYFVINLQELIIVNTKKHKSDWYISTPLWQQVIDWFREEHNIHLAVTSYTNPSKIGDKQMYETLIGHKENNFDATIANSTIRLTESFKNKVLCLYNLYDTYEEAREQAILEAIKLCKYNEKTN